MSLGSRGISFSTYVVQSIAPLEDPRTGIKLPEVTFSSSTDKNGIEARREAFLQLMTKFANSEQFEAATHSLMPLFVLNVQGLVNTVMPD